MDRSELLFRNGCQKWHAYLERCAKDGRLDEASQLLIKIGQYLAGWKESLAAASAETREAEQRVIECRRKEASIHLHLRMLGQLLATMNHKIVAQAQKKAEEAKASKRERFEHEQSEEKKKKEKKEKEERERRERRERNKENKIGGHNE